MEAIETTKMEIMIIHQQITMEVTKSLLILHRTIQILRTQRFKATEVETLIISRVIKKVIRKTFKCQRELRKALKWKMSTIINQPKKENLKRYLKSKITGKTKNLITVRAILKHQRTPDQPHLKNKVLLRILQVKTCLNKMPHILQQLIRN